MTTPATPSSSAAVCAASAPAAHTITALRYRLHRGPVDLAPLVVRQTRRFTWGDAQVMVSILAASHALTVMLPNQPPFTELLTCLPPGEPQGETGREWRVPAGAGAGDWRQTLEEGALRGTVRITAFALTPDRDAALLRLTCDDALAEPFVRPGGETAWTRVGWRSEGSRLFVETIHTYPEDGAGLRSETCLWLANDAEKTGQNP